MKASPKKKEVTVLIPSSEAWVYKNPEVIGKIRKGLREAGEAKKENVGEKKGR